MPLPTSTAPPLPRPRLLTALAQAALLAALPDGGQRAARRNAWAGMSRDSARGRGRREVAAALARPAPPKSGRGIAGGR